MAIQNDNTILNKGDLKAYHQKILPYLGGNFMMSTNNSDYVKLDGVPRIIGVFGNVPMYKVTYTVNGLIDQLGSNWITSKNLDIQYFLGADILMYASNDLWLSHDMKWNKQTGAMSTSLVGYCYTISLYYTKTTDTSATTTPGAYDINFPNTWPANTEIYFGNGVYGYRATGNMPVVPNTGGSAKVCEVRISGVTNILQFGGTYTQTQIASPSSHHPRRFVSNNNNANGDSYGNLSVYQWVSGAALQIDYNVPNNGTTWGLETTVNDTYDVWVTYTK